MATPSEREAERGRSGAETHQQPPPPAESTDGVAAPQDRGERDGGATLADLRRLRRWVAVAGVWAVAASAIALIALFADDPQPTPNGPDPELRAEIADVANRADRLEDRVALLFDADDEQTEDLSEVGNRIDELQERVGEAQAAAGDASGLSEDVTTLQNRVDALESQGSGDGAQGASGTEDGQ